MEKVRYTILVALATLGVLFIILMIIPEDEDITDPAGGQETAEVQEYADDEDDEDIEAGSDEEEADTDIEEAEEEAEAVEEQEAEDKPDEKEDAGNTVSVNIPDSEISDKALSFRTSSLDNKEVTQDIFSDYDITVVHVWGTFCQPCIAEMGDYAKFYKDLPDNVNLIAVVCDVYDGIDSNVSEANDILSDAGAKFKNLRTSDDLYDVIGSFQYVPSSFFVDKNGHIIGEMMDGASFSDTKSRLEGYLK